MPRKLDKDFSKYIENFLKARKIELYLGEKVEAIEDKVERKRVITSKRVIEADFVVLVTGFKPNAFLAGKSGYFSWRERRN